jgi:prepilin-type N-terminal cleavage/methylation domain-containing protein
MNSRTRTSRGFTLIELLVVISIISLLSSVVISALNIARAKGYDAQRQSNLLEVQKALYAYYAETGTYPVPNGCSGASYGSGNYAGLCQNGCYNGGSLLTPGSPNAMMSPNPLIPNYISSLPVDPKMNVANNTCCYEYAATASDIKFKLNACPTASGANPTGILHDPNPGDASGWAIYTNGASGW